MSEEGGEKTEEASEQQIEKFRREGKVASSRELAAAISLGGGVLGLVMAVPWLGSALLELGRASLAHAAEPSLTIADVPDLAVGIVRAVGPGVAIALAPAAVVTTGVSLVLTGFNLTTEAIEPKLERLDPIGGASRIVSSGAWEGLAKALVAFAVIGWAGWAAVAPYIDVLPAAASLPAGSQARVLGELVRDLLVRTTIAALVLGAADFGWQKWRMIQQMMMTKQQVREEHKESEGDPQIRAQRRRRARQIATGKMLRDVTRADVVVTNPTHYAVALRYRKEENAAPVVLARGVDHMALQIKKIAGRSDIAIIENRPLARALYATAKVGLPIPKELYGPVAQVLAAVYRRRRKTSR